MVVSFFVSLFFFALDRGGEPGGRWDSPVRWVGLRLLRWSIIEKLPRLTLGWLMQMRRSRSPRLARRGSRRMWIWISSEGVVEKG